MTSARALPRALGCGLLVMALMAVTAPGTARAVVATSAEATPVLEDYVVKNGDTCQKIAQDRYGNPHAVAEIHKYNTNLGPSPHRLHVGSILRLPVTNPDSGPEAQITFVRNQVEAFTPDPNPAQVNEELYRGHKVSTKDQSSAELLFVDETRVQLGERSLIVMLGGSRAAKESPVETTLVTGALRARLGELVAGAPPRRPTVVKTDAAEVALGTGEVKVDVDDKKDTRLAVYRGRSTARTRRKAVEVPEGFGSRTEVGKDPGAPQPLPPAPVWTTAPPVTLAVADVGAFTATYGQSEGAAPVAAAWHVQIARDEGFNDLAVDVKVPVTSHDLQAKALVPGVYRVRVSAIDADAFEGPFGVSTTTSVALAPPPPPPPPPPTAVVPPPPPPPPPPGPRLEWSGAVVGGLDVSASPQGRLGPALGLELDLARPRPEATFTPVLGLRALYEHLGASGPNSGSVEVAHRDGFDIVLLAMARFGKTSSRVNAYLGLTPQVSIARVREISDRVFEHAWVGIGGLAGLGVKLGPGRLMLEVDGHYPTRRPILSPEAQLGFLQVLTGYRLAF